MAKLGVSLGIGILGFAAGAPFGLAFTVGTFVANALFPTTIEGPRFDDFRVSRSSYGLPLPIIFATLRVEGHLVDALDVREEVKKSGGGFLGSLLGQPKVKTFEYYATLFYAMAEGPIDDVTRLWFDRQLVLDRRATNTGPVNEFNLRVVAILGSETQSPSPRLQEKHGTDLTPAYRGTGGVLIEDLPLHEFGNRIPNVEGEVVAVGSDAFIFDQLVVPDEIGNLITTHIARSLTSPFMYVSGWVSTGNNYVLKYDALTGDLIHWVRLEDDPVLDTANNLFRYGNSVVGHHNGNLYVTQKYASASTRLIELHRDTLQVVSWSSAPFAWNLAEYTAAHPIGLFCTTFSSNPGNVCLWNGIGNLTRVMTADHNTDYFGDQVQCCQWAISISTVWLAGGSTLREWLWDEDTQEPREIFNFDLTSLGLTNIREMAYWAEADLFILADGTTGLMVSVSPSAPTVAVKTYATNYRDDNTSPSGGNHSGFATWLDAPYLVYTDDINNDYWRLDLVTGDEVFMDSEPDYGMRQSVNTDTTTQVYEPLTQTIWTNTTSGSAGARLDYGRVFLPKTAGDTVTLRSILEAISERVGLVSADYDFTAQTDAVRGFKIPGRGPARRAIEELEAAFLFRTIEEDWIVLGKRLDGGIDRSIPEVDLGAVDDPDGTRVDKLPRTRTPERDLPLAVSATYFDPARDYLSATETAMRSEDAVHTDQIASMGFNLVFTSDEAATLVARLLYMVWSNRDQYTLHLSHEYMDLSAVDRLAVTVGESTFEMRVTDRNLGANFLVRLRAASDDTGVYSITATGASNDDFPEQSIDVRPNTRLFIQDVALLSMENDKTGLSVHGAATSGATGWSAALVQLSDDTVVWDDVTGLDEQEAAGSARTILPDTDSPFAFDDDTILEVGIMNGAALSTLTKRQVTDDRLANLAMVGDELVQFATATLKSPGVYELTNLLRGRFGTDDVVGDHTAAGEDFSVISTNNPVSVDFLDSEISALRYWRAITRAQTYPGVEEIAHTLVAGRLMPRQVYAAEASGAPGSTITVTFRTRSRDFRGPFLNHPLFEDSESYELVIRDAPGGTELNSYIVATKSFTYTQAQQDSDHGSPSATTIYATLYQRNAVVGRGRGLDIVLT